MIMITFGVYCGGILGGILTLYFLFRLLTSALFRSYFEAKQRYEKQEDEDDGT